MPTEADFLAAIHAEPDDETNKLVFADWLEEHGDLRAGLVRRIVRYQDLTDKAADCFERGGVLPLLDGRFAPWLEPLTRRGEVTLAERGLLCLRLDDPGRQKIDVRDLVWGWVTELPIPSVGDGPAVVELASRLKRPT